MNRIIEDEAVDLENIEEEKRKLYREIEALPEKSREVFKAIVLNNLKYKEAAEELGVSVNAIKTHYNAEIGEYLTIARKERNAKNWALGSITNEDSRILMFRLHFWMKE